MAQILAAPKARDRNQAYGRAISVRDALSQLRSGGTAADVRAVVMEESGQRVGLDAIQRALWLLHVLGVVQYERNDKRCRWWSLKQPFDPKAAK